MKISVARELIKTNVKSQLKGKQVQPVVLAGKPGISKSRSIEGIAKELNLHCISLSLPSISSEEMSGLPTFVDMPDITKYSTTNTKLAQGTEWTAANLIVEANRLAMDTDKDGCILLLDDIHLLNMSVAPYFYALLENRQMGLYKLDEKVAIVCTMNDSDEAGFSGMQSPIKDRCSILSVEFDFDPWYDAYGKYLNYFVSSFIKLYPQYIQEDESTAIEQFLTPRSCTYFGHEIDEYTKEFLVENAMDLAKMKMSENAAIAFTKHVEYLNRIDFSNIVKNKEKIDFTALNPIDEILYAYIINYIETIEDAKYLCSLVDDNIEYASFLGFLSGETYTKFLIESEGKKVTKGQSEFIKAIIDPSNAKCSLKNREKFYSYIIEFL